MVSIKPRKKDLKYYENLSRQAEYEQSIEEEEKPDKIKVSKSTVKSLLRAIGEASTDKKD